MKETTKKILLSIIVIIGIAFIAYYLGIKPSSMFQSWLDYKSGNYQIQQAE